MDPPLDPRDNFVSLVMLYDLLLVNRLTGREFLAVLKVTPERDIVLVCGYNNFWTRT